MFSQYFGQFLLSRGLVSATDLERALSVQHETRMKLGVLAMNAGLLSAAQVQTIHEAQTRTDKRFGELAVELGFLSAADVDRLVASQRTANSTLGQTLVDQGSLSYERLESALRQYKEEEYGLSDAVFASMSGGSVDAIVSHVFERAGLGARPRLTEYAILFAKNMIRFVDDDVLLEVRTEAPDEPYEWVASQRIHAPGGAPAVVTAIAGTQEELLRLASAYAQEAVDEPGEMMEAAVGEWLNLHNGIYLVNRSNEGVELGMGPQTVVPGDRSELPPERVIVRIAGIRLSFDLIIPNLDALS